MKKVLLWVLFVYALAGADWAFGTDIESELAKYQTQMQEEQQKAAQLQQQLVNTQTTILQLQGAISALTVLQNEGESSDEAETNVGG